MPTGPFIDSVGYGGLIRKKCGIKMVTKMDTFFWGFFWTIFFW